MAHRKKRAPVLSDEQLRPLVERAVADLQAKTAALDGIVHFAESDWSVDQDQGTIVFSRKDGLRATAPVQVIGTYNTNDKTWLWSWDNPSIDAALQRDALALRDYGRHHQIEPLITRKFACAESDCWELVALACLLCEAQGGYRGPAGATLVFMLFGQVQLSRAMP